MVPCSYTLGLPKFVKTYLMTAATFRSESPGGKKPSTKFDVESAPLQGTDDSGYSHYGILDVVKERWGWLVFFFAGLLFAAFVVESFEDMLEKNVQISFFVPLLMGHGGNTGSQTVSTVIKALALKQIKQRELASVVWKEACAGVLMGALLGAIVLAASFVWPGLDSEVGAVVAIALPVVSLWSNGLGAFLTLVADRYKMNPAVTSVPLLTTIVDSTGLVIYFYIAKLMLGLAGK